MELINRHLDKIVSLFACLAILFSHDLPKFSHVFSAMAIIFFVFFWYKKNKFNLSLLRSDKWLVLLIFAGSLFPGLVLANHLDRSFHTFLKYVVFWPVHGLISYMMVKEKKCNVIYFFVPVLFLCVEGIYAFYEYAAGINLRSGGFIGGYSLLFCTVLMIHMSCCYVVLFEKYFDMTLKIGVGIVGTAILLGIFGTCSRGGFLTIFAYILISLIVFWKKYRKKCLICLGVLSCVLCIFWVNPHLHARMISVCNVTTDISNSSRINAWEHVWIIVKEKPFSGIGLGNWRIDYDIKFAKNVRRGNEVLTHAHSNVMHMLAEGGIPAAIGYLSFMMYYAMYGWRKYRYNGNPYGLMLCGIVFILNLHGITDYNFGWHYVSKNFFHILGCLMALMEYYDEKNV